MKIELNPGESLTITLAGTDGEFQVHFNERGVEVTADVPDDEGRTDVIYSEKFRFNDETDDVESHVHDSSRHCEDTGTQTLILEAKKIIDQVASHSPQIVNERLRQRAEAWCFIDRVRELDEQFNK